MLRRLRRRSDEPSRQSTARREHQVSSRRVSSDQERLLLWVADQVAQNVDALPEQLPHGIDPTSLTPQQARIAAQRWFLLLNAARKRSAACARAILVGMQTQGFGLSTLNTIARSLCPAVGELRGTPDREYMLAELAHATTPTYDSLIRLAIAMLNHDRAESCRQAREAARLDPGRHEADICLARAASLARLYADACRHFDDAERKGCTDCFEAHAQAANKAGQSQAVLDLCTRAGAATSDRLRLEKAHALRVLGRVPDALNELSLIASATPDVDAEFGECYLAQDRLALAAKTTESGARAGNMGCLRVHGVALSRLGHHPEAARALRELVREEPSQSPDLWYRLAFSALMAGQDDLAFQATEHVLSSWPDHHAALQIQAETLVRLGQYQQAHDLCRAHAQRYPLLEPSYLVLMLIELGEMQQAMDQLRVWRASFRDEQPPTVLYWVLNGYLYERLGRFQDAITYYREALAVNPRHPEARSRYDALVFAQENDLLPHQEVPETPDARPTTLTAVNSLD